jgi:hypothetical protein
MKCPSFRFAGVALLTLLAGCATPAPRSTTPAVCAVHGVPLEPSYYFCVMYSVSNAALVQAYAAGGNASLRALIEKQCGRFSTNSAFSFEPTGCYLFATLHLDERLRFMLGMAGHLDISAQDLASQQAHEAAWSVDRARTAARRDITNQTIRIYWAGGIASSPCGVPEKYASLILNLPKADAGIGCTPSVPPEAFRYGVEYNRVILGHLLGKTELRF